MPRESEVEAFVDAIGRGGDGEHPRRLRRVLAQAVASRSHPEQGLLRARFVEGRSLDQLAQAQGVSREEIAARLARARMAIRTMAVRRLRAELGGAVTDAPRLVRVVRGELDRTLAALLSTRQG